AERAARVRVARRARARPRRRGRRCRPRRAAPARLEARAGALRRNGAAGGAAGGLSHMARGVTPLLVAACLGGAAAAAQVPSPASVLGFAVGADRSLADWILPTAYFKRLAAASDRVKLDTLEIGRASCRER